MLEATSHSKLYSYCISVKSAFSPSNKTDDWMTIEHHFIILGIILAVSVVTGDSLSCTEPDYISNALAPTSAYCVVQSKLLCNKSRGHSFGWAI